MSFQLTPGQGFIAPPPHTTPPQKAYRSAGGMSFLSSFSSARNLPLNEPLPHTMSIGSQQSVSRAGGAGVGVQSLLMGSQGSLAPLPAGGGPGKRRLSRETEEAERSENWVPSEVGYVSQNNVGSSGFCSEERVVEEALNGLQSRELVTQFYCSQRLLQETQEREKSLQYKVRVLDTELAVLRRVRPPLVVQIGRNRMDPRSRKYVQYEVCVERTSSVASQGVQFSLWRRFSQFTALRKELVKQCPPEASNCVPHLPSKKFFGNLDAEFVAARGQSLQWYLQQICAIEPLRRCDCFREFLSSTTGNGVIGGDVAAGEREVFA